MKRIITIIALALASISLSAKEIVKNPVTNKVLDKTAGIYSIKGPKGITILGTEEMAKEFMLSAMEAFSKEILHSTFKIGDDQFEVMKDDAGLYIMKIGLGVVKNEAKARELFQRAVKWFEQDIEENAYAPYYLAQCYNYGFGVDMDHEKSVELYLKAAIMGNSQALVSLAVEYQMGNNLITVRTLDLNQEFSRIK